MASFDTTKSGGLVMKAYESTSILADPATESARIPQMRVAVSELVQKLKASKSKVRYAISGQSVFTRFVKLPALDDDNIEQLVAFEAQQHVPIPINEAVWDYQLFEAGGEKEVVLVAIKEDSLEEINQAVNDAGVSTLEVDVAPMALYNAFRYNYPEVDEPTLLIDIGTKSSNLLYIEGKRFFTRVAPVGGASLTSAIAKEYGVSFAEAEVQKTANGMVVLQGGHTEVLEEAYAALAMVIRNALTRLPAEIARTTNYYRSQMGGSAPKRVFIAGGGANLLYVREFFEEKLHLPVEYFNPLRNVSLGKGVDPEVVKNEAHMMGELVGLGLRGTSKVPVTIDLVPGSVEQERAASRRRPMLIAAAAALVAGTGIWALMNLGAAKKAEEMASSRDENRTGLEEFATPIKQLVDTEGKIKAVGDEYVAAERGHVYWIDLINELKAGMASDAAWVVELDPLVNYDPTAVVDEKNKEDLDSKALVRADFATATDSGKSALESKALNPPRQDSATKPQQGKPQAAAPTPMVTAVRVKGLWRENPKSAQVVYDLIKRLRERPEAFSFKIKDAKAGKEVDLPDEKIVKVISTQAAEGEFALPFELVLPLARPIPVK